MRYAAICSGLLATALHLPVAAAPALQTCQPPERLDPVYLQQRLHDWQETYTDGTPEQLSEWLAHLYLQWGLPGVRVSLSEAGCLQIQEWPNQTPRIARLQITGGTPHMRYLARENLSQQPGVIFDYARLLHEIDWLSHNHFLPIQLELSQEAPDSVALHLHIAAGAEWIPTGNLALNDVAGLALTAGVIADNPFGQGNVLRAVGKRNNIPFAGSPVQSEIQDWEYILSWSTTALPWEGMTLGINHYNKIDYIYPSFEGEANDLVWIRSLGADIFSGFPIWSDPTQRRYLRGVVNLTLTEDLFATGSQNERQPESLSISGKPADLLLMPGLTVSYSDIDDYRIPRNGNFGQVRINGSLLDARFVQATLTGLSLWTPWEGENQRLTLLLRSAAGSTFGNNPPFYRGFLNTGNWLVRGATQFSVTEKHSLRFAEELHYIYTPTALELENFSQLMFGGPGLSALDGWSFDANLFLDQGAYWRNSWEPRSPQFSIGAGLNAITPIGAIIGVDLAQPVWPGGPVTALLRISAPLSFTLYSDWINSNGFFLR
ncbi:MAG: BamA/TamA family outer membrane protein [Candidatus Sericytochromatia bacterium]|nr:BamA/TamA family outer membrane protein [Candidatus Sericytochromatia bacterium]